MNTKARNFPVKHIFSIMLLSLIISGCASKLPSVDNSTPQQNTNIQTSSQRAEQLLALQHWKLKGKIAFISPKDKESAGISWTVNEKEHTQQLNLNSYLGINVLDLNSVKSKHTIKVDGEVYTGNDLPELIYTLTGLTLPTQALNFWLKGLPYQQEDIIEFDKVTNLPTQLTSFYQSEEWRITYQRYKEVNSYKLATKLNIEKDDLLIKFSIKQWQVLP